MVITVIPAKPFTEAKTRLAPALSARQRVSLVRGLLAQTIRLAAQVSEVVVVSRSAGVRRLAGQLGAHSLAEKQADLNAAIRQGIAWAQAQGGSSVLILPLDLPLLSAPALAQLVSLGRQNSPGVVIAPCRRYQGTNALFLTPPAVIAPCFGLNSFVEHKKLCQQAGLVPQVFDTPELAFDIDTPEDWYELISQKEGLA